MEIENALVVVVSGTSGAGKSTLLHGLAVQLQQRGLRVETVHFDDFTSESDLPDGDIRAWLTRGALPDEWRTPALERRLIEVAGGAGSAGGGRAEVVLVEEPFGRSRTVVDRLTGFAVHLELSLHAALARRLLRQFVPATGGLDDTSTGELRDYLSRYLGVGVEFYEAIESAAAGSADAILDAAKDPADLVEQVMTAVIRRLDVRQQCTLRT
ncbi:nucleotide-binding protein [Microlunatus antarcticus]|uniref:Energy-coupling factor transporter ATP-binding protein EcfA2 n=1 Tax=Microlunatus antarcticus TaxID=53388 RepID=A0A7W5P6D9_9ACTN|nr:energy-coupling factor transporter ATP-binding protein EcfA2 [Microlunatus antarcticus]